MSENVEPKPQTTDESTAGAEAKMPGLLSADHWLRGVFMLLFIIANYCVRLLIMTLVLFQFIYTLFVGTPNENVLNFSKQLSRYAYQILLFITYNTDDKPFPFASWPSEEVAID